MKRFIIIVLSVVVLLSGILVMNKTLHDNALETIKIDNYILRQQCIKFDDVDFNLSLFLPNEWTLLHDNTVSYVGLQNFDNRMLGTVSIMGDDGKKIGAIGYCTYILYEGAEDLPQAIYSNLTVGNGYHWDAQELYEEVIEAKNQYSALTYVFYSPAYMEGKTGVRCEKINRGILAYDKEHLIYVALEFEKDLVSEAVIKEIASNLEFCW